MSHVSPLELENDWGVPLPGPLVAGEQLADTHLARLPLGVLDATAVFGRQAPLIVDLGCGNGRSTILGAQEQPTANFLAIDQFPGAIRHAVRRANRRGLHHVRFAVADARDVVGRLLANQSVAEVHLYHPQPIYDLAQAPKRLLTPSFLLHIHRVLIGDGTFLLQTDHPAYWKYLRDVLPLFFTMHEEETAGIDIMQARSRREILARQLGLPIFRVRCFPHANLDRQAAQRQADQLPLPRFDADRRLQQLEEMEAGSSS